jgi:ankyrin repeat protein
MGKLILKNTICCFVFLLLLTSFMLPLGCKDKQSYINEITRKGITYSIDSFLNEAGAGNKDRVELFIKAGMNVDARSNNGYTALMLASAYNNFEVVKLLIENRANANVKDNDGYTALMFASPKGYLEVATLLIESGADVNARNDAGETALMIASLNSNIRMAQLLIKDGADVNAKSNNGNTALKYAFLDTRMSDLLRKAGARE